MMARGQLKLAVRAGKVSWCSVSERLPSAVGGGPGSTKVRHRRPLVRTLQPSAGCRRPLVRALQPPAASLLQLRAARGHHPAAAAAAPASIARPPLEPPPPRPAFGQWYNRSSRFVYANPAFRSSAPRRWIQRSFNHLLILTAVLPTEWCTICCGPSLTRRHFLRGRDIPSCSSDHVFTFCWIAMLDCNSWLECAKRDSNPSTLGLKANVPTIKPSAREDKQCTQWC